MLLLLLLLQLPLLLLLLLLYITTAPLVLLPTCATAATAATIAVSTAAICQVPTLSISHTIYIATSEREFLIDDAKKIGTPFEIAVRLILVRSDSKLQILLFALKKWVFLCSLIV